MAGYFRKAQALAGQNKLVDAAATYLQCLLLDESREVKNHLAKVVSWIISKLSTGCWPYLMLKTET